MKQISAFSLVVILSIIFGAQAKTRFCDGIWQPAPGTSWMWQIYNTPTQAEIDAAGVQVVDIDMINTPVSTIDYIHSKGKAVICYVDTAYEPNRTDSSQFEQNPSVIGKDLIGWPGQHWVDIRSSVVRKIMASRAATAFSKGCDAIEWDDVDAYANDSGFTLVAADQLDFNIFLANMTHQLGMSVGLKNDLDQVNQLVNYFDWALNEQCYALGECSVLSAFVNQGKAVFGTEYEGDPKTFCPVQNAAKFSWLMSSMQLDGTGVTKCCNINDASQTCPTFKSQCNSQTITPTTAPAPTTPTTAPAPTTTTPTPTPDPDANSPEHLPSSAVSSFSLSAVVVALVALLAVSL